MIVVPGITGTTDPIKPIAIKTMATSHQNTTMEESELDPPFAKPFFDGSRLEPLKADNYLR
jgi:hypothetical protein